MLADGQWGSDLRAYISSSLIIEHDPYDEYAAEPLLAGSNGTDYPRRRSSFDLHYVRARLGYAHAAAEDETDVETACDAMGGAGTNVADGHLDEYINTDPRTGAVTGLSVMRRTWLYETEEDTDNDDNGTDNGHPLYEHCWCHLYICQCPSQGRYFGDRRSLVDFFDPLDRSEAYCA